MEILRYKGYEGTAEVDIDAGMCHGRILFIADAVTYRAEGPRQLQAEFEAAVDDYLETCAELGRMPQKPLNGVFNVRVPPTLHRQARLRAVADDCSLNEVVTQALVGYLHSTAAVPTPVLEATLERAVRRAHSHIAEVARAQVQLGLADALGGARDYYDARLPTSRVAPSDPYPRQGSH